MRADRIVIADDHPVFREGLRRLIQGTASNAEVIEADTFRDMIQLAREGPVPTTFIVDLMFGDRSVETSLSALRLEFCRTSIIVLSMVDDRTVAERILSKGVDGFISKTLSPREIVAAIAAVRNGDQVLLLEPTFSALSDRDDEPAALTRRQRDVLRLLTAGKTNKEIAQALQISPFTVRIHVSALLKTLGVSSRTAAAAKATAYGLA
ncbi:LuxR C-terminal-related transcriptional regulator [Chelativorans alearense]|uniref:LuxR C-terminal-related transcriptional regulator n=1 Tax=Chelativorans alearense TaxID=2681495 RepID=UPI0013D2D842|nr:response regulator transcription factor [Chelativorans alearense]